MAVSIRLTRAGRKHLPFYHIGVFNSRTRRDGRPIEDLGFYDPTSKTEQVRLNTERATYWLGEGARPSETVASILKAQGLSSELWRASRKKKASKPKEGQAVKREDAKKARTVKTRTKKRTAKSVKPRKEKK